MKLRSFQNVVLDMCNLHATVINTPKLVSTFKALLVAERIHFKSLPGSDPLSKATVRLHTAEDMRRLICKLPSGMHHVAPYGGV